MGKKYEKLKEKVLKVPSDLTYSEMQKFLEHFGYVENQKGKTSGSRVLFFRASDGATIMLHKPHPQKELKEYAIKQVIETLQQYGDLK